MSGPYSIGSKSGWNGLSKLIEEAGEVQQVCGKIIGCHGAEQHWDGSNTRERLCDELGDMIAAIEFVITVNDLDQTRIEAQADMKYERFMQWMREGK